MSRTSAFCGALVLGGVISVGHAMYKDKKDCPHDRAAVTAECRAVFNANVAEAVGGTAVAGLGAVISVVAGKRRTLSP